MSDFTSSNDGSDTAQSSPKKWAWVFPGQGTQHVSMGQALYEGSPAARAVFETADQALGFSLSSLCFEGPADELILTKNGQPAILTTSLAALAALRETYPDLADPGFSLGHSLGEYSALCAAGFFDLRDAVRLVRLRGEAMQDAVPPGEGKMAAIMGGDPAAVGRLCEETAEGDCLTPANFNGPGQIVIAGVAAAVDRACAAAKDRGLKAIPLKVSAPFHCSMMKPASRKVAAALTELPLQPCRFPIIANVNAKPVREVGQVRELLTLQVDHAVLFEQSVRELLAQGVTDVLEIGPGKVLAGLIRRIDKSIRVHGVSTPEDVERVGDLL